MTLTKLLKQRITWRPQNRRCDRQNPMRIPITQRDNQSTGRNQGIAVLSRGMPRDRLCIAFYRSHERLYAIDSEDTRSLHWRVSSLSHTQIHEHSVTAEECKHNLSTSYFRCICQRTADHLKTPGDKCKRSSSLRFISLQFNCDTGLIISLILRLLE